MSQIIKNPNLPEKDVTLAIVGKGDPNIINRLQSLGVETLLIGQNSTLPRPVRYHADMLCHHLGGSEILLEQKEELLSQQLCKRNYVVHDLESPLGENYPYDVSLNAAQMGNYLICNPQYTSKKLLTYIQRKGIEILPVKQGYARCSCCIISPHALITSDVGIARVCRDRKIDCLQIAAGYIQLKGYGYGFIGGASSLIAKDRLLFFGNVHKHPDQKAIHEFCFQHEVEVQSLTSGELVDIGGMILLEEE